MIQSTDYQITISSLGWVDRSSLWVYDCLTDHIQSFPFGGAKYLSLHRCKNPALFAVMHHFEGAQIKISIHTFEEPGALLCSAELSRNGSHFEGKLQLFQEAPRYYVSYFNPGQDADFYLVSIDNILPQIKAERFDWYDNSYDKDYQGIVGVVELPSGDIIVSIQRDSNPVLYDPVNKKVIRKISLAGKLGNPKIQILRRSRELWADDYDTLLKLDCDQWNVKKMRRLQKAGMNTSQFIGNWMFNSDESICFVARPFSGDVLGISTENMKTKYVAKLGKQPLEVGILPNDFLIARDWKSGELLKGPMKRRWLS